MSSPIAPHAADPAIAPKLCQNCGATLQGPYCAKCGQHDVDYHRSFHHVAHDALENLFHFDGKLFVSVACLFAQPGKLTKEFNAGRRASQVPPLRFYIFVTLIFFLGVHLLNRGHLLPIDRNAADQATTNMRESASALAPANLTPAEQRRFGELIGEAAAKNAGNLDRRTIEELLEQVHAESGTAAPPPANGAAPAARRPARPGDDLGQIFQSKLESGEFTVARFLDELERRVPTLLFLGMPIFALLLKVLYLRQGRYYIEHLVFSLHLHTWTFLVLAVGAGYLQLAALGPGWLVTATKWLLTGWMLWYAVKSFRVVYGQSWGKTALKTFLAAGFYFFALVVLLVALIAITIVKLVYL